MSEITVEEEVLDEGEDEGTKEDTDDGGTKEEEKEGDSDEGDFPWPDTTISVAHVSGDK